jgi:hypothetical protein
MIAFIRGACGAVSRTRIPSAAEDLIEHCGELRVAVTNQEPEATSPITQLENQILGLLGDPVGGRVGGDTQDMDAASGVLHDGEAVQPGEGDRVGVEEIAGQDPGRLGTQELTPTRSGASRSRIDAGLVQDPPDRGSAYFPAQPGKFPGDSAVPQVGFSAARRNASARTVGRTGGRPGGVCS